MRARVSRQFLKHRRPSRPFAAANASARVVLQSKQVETYGETSDEDVPTETPPPYFPQNPLSPGDEKTARRMRMLFYGCAGLAVAATIGALALIVYLLRSLL